MEREDWIAGVYTFVKLVVFLAGAYPCVLLADHFAGNMIVSVFQGAFVRIFFSLAFICGWATIIGAVDSLLGDKICDRLIDTRR